MKDAKTTPMTAQDFFEAVESAKKEISTTLYEVLWDRCVAVINSPEALSKMLNSNEITFTCISDAEKRYQDEAKKKEELKGRYKLSNESFSKFEQEAIEAVNAQLVEYGWMLQEKEKKMILSPNPLANGDVIH